MLLAMRGGPMKLRVSCSRRTIEAGAELFERLAADDTNTNVSKMT